LAGEFGGGGFFVVFADPVKRRFDHPARTWFQGGRAIASLRAGIVERGARSRLVPRAR